MGAADAITAGPDGNVWFTERNGDKIGRITPDGTVTDWPVPTEHGGPLGIVAGPDGNIWFAEKDRSQIGRLTLPIPPDVAPITPIEIVPIKPPPILPAIKCTVPSLSGLTLAAAKVKLTKAHCRLGIVVRPKHALASKLRVSHQLTKAGTHTTHSVSISLAIPVVHHAHRHVVKHKH
jgi:hypothetical protein